MNGHPEGPVSQLIAVRSVTLEQLRNYAAAKGGLDYSEAIGHLLASASRAQMDRAGIVRRVRAWEFEAICECGWSLVLRGRRKRAELHLSEHRSICPEVGR